MYQRPLRSDEIYSVYISATRPNVLYHHGVKGQKWGVRNGPPYPVKNAPFVPKSIKATTANGIKVNTMSKHVVDQIRDRKFSGGDVVDAIKKPLEIHDIKIDEEGRKSQRFVGEKATVNVNPDTGNLITAWKTGKSTIEKIKRKREGES